MTMTNDPLLAQLNRIEQKQDTIIENQTVVNERLDQIHKDCKRTALVNGAAAGGLAGGLVTTAIELLRVKFGG
ncbi:hypothetical protein [Snodgrassella sp. CFCC 13594]|uniref:hypothetical protein n=1 Tax=Snodgrassella sp. CFCC 13594 TaxID=1775559 RepID=UPI000830F100|nr:hypothetical protein [Snodgrassella sp. CFCC 13594]